MGEGFSPGPWVERRRRQRVDGPAMQRGLGVGRQRRHDRVPDQRMREPERRAAGATGGLAGRRVGAFRRRHEARRQCRTEAGGERVGRRPGHGGQGRHVGLPAEHRQGLQGGSRLGAETGQAIGEHLLRRAGQRWVDALGRRPHQLAEQEGVAAAAGDDRDDPFGNQPALGHRLGALDRVVDRQGIQLEDVAGGLVGHLPQQAGERRPAGRRLGPEGGHDEEPQARQLARDAAQQRQSVASSAASRSSSTTTAGAAAWRRVHDLVEDQPSVAPRRLASARAWQIRRRPRRRAPPPRAPAWAWRRPAGCAPTRRARHASPPSPPLRGPCGSCPCRHRPRRAAAFPGRPPSG